MTVVRNEKKFDRILTIAAGFLCLFAFVCICIALCTPSWTINEYSSDGEVQWHGLFYKCNRFQCILNYNDYIWAIFVTIISAIFLLLATISIFLKDLHDVFQRYFYITSLITFISALLLFIGIVLYTHQSIINGISARIMIVSIVLACLSSSIVSYIAGRHSIFYLNNRTNFHFTKTENTEAIKTIEAQQMMPTQKN
ncbi:unnamed protein product [Rotaria sp. Silwood1]|nr:unnamed protein product [Rotaria sp. Silwood1]CAF3358421.1 unnamed protein product [Rotaria sp. Silwood1]CAF3381629.1 unnamed protein product [Rotaria sp. Silwood1]CAF4526390.1 unnamed protein product [Rotaria sp. Silwood1]CAF4594096.1 unnamed protein product [Rotaria sp. Silwood1]